MEHGATCLVLSGKSTASFPGEKGQKGQKQDTDLQESDSDYYSDIKDAIDCKGQIQRFRKVKSSCDSCEACRKQSIAAIFSLKGIKG